MKVYVSGQKAFGAAAAAMVLDRGHDLVGVASPAEGGDGLDRLRDFSAAAGVPWTDAALFGWHRAPDDTDVLISAHSHAFIGQRSRARARLAAIGYHPSLLPLHRGRDAVRWTIRDGDRVTGGTVYHLTGRVDAGPVAAQRHVLVPPGSTARTLWRDLLFPLGISLLAEVLADLADGHVGYEPQDERLATWEPSWDRPPLHRPELPELTAGTPGPLEYRRLPGHAYSA